MVKIAVHLRQLSQNKCFCGPLCMYLQGSTFNWRLSVSLHQLSGTLCLHLLKVPLPSPHSRHIWKQNCSLLHTTQSNISSAASASNSNSRHTAPPISVFDIWHICVLSGEQMVELECAQMHKFISLHVSDHSGFHYQQFLLNSLQLLHGDAQFLSCLRSELQLTQELIQLYPGHEAIWYHRYVDAVSSCLPCVWSCPAAV